MHDGYMNRKDDGSPACRHAGTPRKGQLIKEKLVWAENGLPTKNRTFFMDVPQSYHPGQVTPLLFIFHGWGGEPKRYHSWSFGNLSEKHGFIAVYPRGIADCAKGADCQTKHNHSYTSWNAAGTSGSSNTWTSCDVDHLPSWTASKSYCYESCVIRKGRCHICDWTTCYDDVAFIEALLDHVGTKYCIDQKQVFAYGCSNGGLLVHQLAQSLSTRFAAVAAGCGAKPHIGMEANFDVSGLPVSMLLVQGRQDHVIPTSVPPLGTSWWDGALYANVTSVLKAYKRYNRCSNAQPQAYPTPYVANKMVCSLEGYDCYGNVSVVYCAFDGTHDLNWGIGNDDLYDEPQVVWEFFASHARIRSSLIEISTSGASSNGQSVIIPIIVIIIVLLSGLLAHVASTRAVCSKGDPCKHDKLETRVTRSGSQSRDFESGVCSPEGFGRPTAVE